MAVQYLHTLGDPGWCDDGQRSEEIVRGQWRLGSPGKINDIPITVWQHRPIVLCSQQGKGPKSLDAVQCLQCKHKPVKIPDCLLSIYKNNDVRNSLFSEHKYFFLLKHYRSGTPSAFSKKTRLWKQTSCVSPKSEFLIQFCFIRNAQHNEHH